MRINQGKQMSKIRPSDPGVGSLNTRIVPVCSKHPHIELKEIEVLGFTIKACYRCTSPEMTAKARKTDLKIHSEKYTCAKNVRIAKKKLSVNP